MFLGIFWFQKPQERLTVAVSVQRRHMSPAVTRILGVSSKIDDSRDKCLATACRAIGYTQIESCKTSTWERVTYTGPILNGQTIYFWEKGTLAFRSSTIKNCLYVPLLSLYSLSSTIIIF